jgi:hypothetical protein
LVWIALSTYLAIARNVTQSAARTNFWGSFYNLGHFRPIGWHDDYFPISDLVAYGVAGILIVLVISYLREQDHRDAKIFRPLMIGLIIASLWGILQSMTGYGIPHELVDFRKDFFGYAAIGFQPDLHAYAGHLLLGALGLFGYFFIIKQSVERKIILLVCALSWFSLLLSKSRSSLLIAIFAAICIFLILAYQRKISIFYLRAFGISALLIVATLGVTTILGLNPSLGWVGELLQQLQLAKLSNLNQLGGIMGSRFEIWTAAANMIAAFPLVGIGQGEFYRLSANVAFSKSQFLFLNNGENAHNYFLQTLAELGVIGFGLLACAVIFPFWRSRDRRYLIPAGVGLASLFLGNIFSHAFLVRENLLIAAMLIALAYSWLYDERSNLSLPFSSGLKPPKDRKWHDVVWFMPVGLAILSLWGGYEVWSKWGSEPFKSGVACQKNLPISGDGWSSGVYELVLPTGTSGVNLPIEVVRPSLNRYPLNLKLSLIHSKIFNLPVQNISYSQISKDVLVVKLPEGNVITESNIRLRLELSDCYTPRNLGGSTDGRRLGILIKPPIFY